MKRIAIYAGSFDPVTYGHLDIMERAANVTDELIVCVMKNSAKTPLFSADERVTLLQEVTGNLSHVRVESFDGLLAEFASLKKASLLVRGVRTFADFEYEQQLAQVNRTLLPSLETVYLATNPKYGFLSSSIVKELASYGRDISALVPPSVAAQVQKRIKERRHEQN